MHCAAAVWKAWLVHTQARSVTPVHPAAVAELEEHDKTQLGGFTPVVAVGRGLD